MGDYVLYAIAGVTGVYTHDWRVLNTLRQRVLVAYTLSEYIQDATLRERLRADSPVVQRFRGSLSCGDIVVCEPGRSGRRP